MILSVITLYAREDHFKVALRLNSLVFIIVWEALSVEMASVCLEELLYVDDLA